jgi:hypothetical protein
MPVAPVIPQQSSRSRSMPTQTAEVPFQAMQWTLASASISAVFRIGG